MTNQHFIRFNINFTNVAIIFNFSVIVCVLFSSIACLEVSSLLTVDYYTSEDYPTG